MATKLKNMKLTSVDLVHAGANQMADVVLHKSAAQTVEYYNEALIRSFRSIEEDETLTSEERKRMLDRSLAEYREAVEALFNPEEDVLDAPEPEEDTDLATDGGDRFDVIQEAGSQIDTIEEVQKFNPFHDALGRFASSNSFRTYSANPKSKAGAMAIGRSARAGHTGTMNVHTESKGENIGQNYDWLQTGKKPAFLTGGSSSQQTPPPPPVPKKKPSSKPKPQKPKAEPSNGKKPAADQSIQDAVAGVKLSSSDKLALQARDGNGQACSTKKIVEDYSGTRIEGQDISKTFDYHAMASAAMNSHGSIKTYAVDAVAEAQGWDKAPPTVISNRDDFDRLCLANGRVMMRTVHAGHGMTAEEVATATMTRSDIALGAGGGTAYGGGLYLVDTKIVPGKSAKVTGYDVAEGQRESYAYGDTQMMATPRPGAKIATPKQAAAMKAEFKNLSLGDRARFQDDYGAYIASKGYDGAKWHPDSDPSAYLTMYNKSALVFFSEVAEK